MKHSRNHTKHSDTLSEHATALVAATAHLAEDKVVEARRRLSDAVERARDMYEDLEENAIKGAKRADTLIRENPYQALGVGLALGALIGFVFARRQ
jgi:ElaB/YqjD/DUF883 family membrane-anchored ribosome-binding protein